MRLLLAVNSVFYATILRITRICLLIVVQSTTCFLGELGLKQTLITLAASIFSLFFFNNGNNEENISNMGEPHGP